MKTISLLLMLGVIFGAGATEWENHRAFAEIRMAPRATFYPYFSVNEVPDGNVWQSQKNSDDLTRYKSKIRIMPVSYTHLTLPTKRT